jgi:hypothetical protein
MITLVNDPSVNTSTGAELLCLAGAVVIIGIAIWLFVRNRSRGKGGGAWTASPDPNDPFGTFTTEQLNADANALPVAGDDALKTSEQELTFATAQYGKGATAAAMVAAFRSGGAGACPAASVVPARGCGFRV